MRYVIDLTKALGTKAYRLVIKAGPFIGPRGGKWADPQHTIPWRQDQPETKWHGEEEVLLTAATQQVAALIREGALSGTPEQHVATARRMIEKHEKALPEIMRTIQRAVPRAKVTGRIKSLHSAVGKITKKPDRYPDPSHLPDYTGTRAVVPTLDSVYSAVDRLRKEFNVTKENDYIKNPKGQYRSYHLVCRSDDGRTFEIQVRTPNQDVIGEWMHHIYKPETPRQKEAHKNEKVLAYEQQIGAYMWALDSGDPPNPTKPDCPDIVREAFGCL